MYVCVHCSVRLFFHRCLAIDLRLFSVCVCVGGSCVITVSKHFCHSGVLTHTEPAAVVCGRPSPVALPVWLCQHVKLQLSDWLPFLSFSSFVQPKLCSHVCYMRQMTHRTWSAGSACFLLS